MVTAGDRREPPAETKCPPAAQRKQAKRACIYIYLDYNSKTDVFRDAIYHIINQCGPRCLKGASGGRFVSSSRTVEASETLVYSMYVLSPMFLFVSPKLDNEMSGVY